MHFKQADAEKSGLSDTCTGNSRYTLASTE